VDAIALRAFAWNRIAERDIATIHLATKGTTPCAIQISGDASSRTGQRKRKHLNNFHVKLATGEPTPTDGKGKDALRSPDGIRTGWLQRRNLSELMPA
jgi:hypothetical protein